MCLLKNSREELSSKLKKSKMRKICTNCKIEIFLLLILAILHVVVISLTEIYFKQYINEIHRVDTVLQGYLTEFRLSLIVSILSIVIGSYITVWSILGTSISKMNRIMLENNLDSSLFITFAFNIALTAFTITFIVFIPNSFNIYFISLFLLIMASSVSFYKFIGYIYKITKISVESIVEEIDENTRKDENIQIKLDTIIKQLKDK